MLLQPGDLVGQDDASPDDYVEISVADTGTGIAPELMAHVFEPLFTTKPIGQGTVLRLSQVYGFVHQSRSVVRLDNEPGDGTTVRIYMPCWTATALAATHVPAPRHDASSPAISEAVLVVEDDDPCAR